MPEEAERHLIVEAAPQRLPEIFEALDHFVDGIWTAFQQLEPSEPSAALVLKHMFDRAFNAFKGAKLLLENDHWELATAQVRLLFEMNLDAEEIVSAEDSDEVALRYAKFGAFEEVRSQIANLKYEIASGRGTPETRARLDDLEARIREWFPDFFKKTTGGRERLQDTWSGRTIRDRANNSSNRMRSYQYDTVFRFLSAYVHANPTSIHGAYAHLGDDFDSRIKSDNRNTVEIVAMLMTLFAELWTTGKEYLPPMPSKVAEAIGSVLTFMGGPSSPTFDE